MLKFYISSFLNYTLTGLTDLAKTDYLRRSHDSFALIAFTFVTFMNQNKFYVLSKFLRNDKTV